jgi:hypothetical protein
MSSHRRTTTAVLAKRVSSVAFLAMSTALFACNIYTVFLRIQGRMNPTDKTGPEIEMDVPDLTVILYVANWIFRMEVGT